MLVVFIASCSIPGLETSNDIEQMSFIQITNSAVEPVVEIKEEVPLESSLQTEIETSSEKELEVVPNKLLVENSCKPGELDCHRFDYATPTGFLNSVVNYAYDNSMDLPIEILSILTIDVFIQVESLEHAENIIDTNPEHMLILGQRIIRKDMPYEWLFAAEQAFLRSWSNLSR